MALQIPRIGGTVSKFLVTFVRGRSSSSGAAVMDIDTRVLEAKSMDEVWVSVQDGFWDKASKSMIMSGAILSIRSLP
jgi:hypothetical protein